MKSEHETLTLGKFTLYRHDYDGEIVQIVIGSEQKAFSAPELELLIEKAFREKG